MNCTISDKIKNFILKNKNIILSIIIIIGIIILTFVLKFPSKRETIDSSYQLYTIELVVDDNYELDFDSSSFTWSSSNNEVAVINNNCIEAKNSGVTNITIYDDGLIIYVYTVKVKDESIDTNLEISVLEFLTNEIILSVDDSYELELNIMPNEYEISKLNWISSDDSIATVVDGVVIGKKAGDCVISVMSDNGLYSDCIVHVIDNVKVENILLSENNKIISVGESYQIKIQVIPEEFGSNVTYSSSNTNVATVSSSGLVKGISSGKVEIIAKVDNKEVKQNLEVIKNAKEIIANFNSNGATSIGNYSEKCVPDKNGCKITMPSITRNGYQVLGWSKDKNAKTADYKVGEKVTINNNITYYAITSKVLTATFNSNGAVASKESEFCTLYNLEQGCAVQLPSISRNDYSVLGWSKDGNSHSADYKVGEKVTINNNITYYAITSKTLTATFNSNRAVISKNSETCIMYNLEQSCSVMTPNISRDNYSALGWGTNSDSANIVARPNSLLSISYPTSYYALTKINTDGIETGCTGWIAVNGYYYSSASTSSLKTNISAGTAFTIEGVDGNFFKVTIPNVSGYKYIEHKYVMINLSDYIPSMTFEIANASSSIYKSSGYALSGVTGTKLYATGKVYNVRLGRNEYMAPILYEVAKKLLIAQKDLQSQGYSIKAYDTYRPRSVSSKIYSSLSELYNTNSIVQENILYSYGLSGTRYTWGKSWFLAPGVSKHNTGSAIDMTLVYKSSGIEVDMPTPMHELSTKAIKYYSPGVSYSPANYSKEMNEVAKIMDNSATKAGLTTLASEWWHFQDTNAHNVILGKNGNGCDFSIQRVYSY